MPSFDAESAVDPMRFRLKADDEYRIIPEPSTLQVQAFMNAQRGERGRLRKELAEIPDDEPLEMTLERLGPEQTEAAVKRNAEMYAALCSGIPSVEELAAMKHRPFAAFASWVSEEILNPEAVTGAGNGQGTTPPSAAAG